MYALVSFTRQNRVIFDCQDLHTNSLMYTFEKIRKSKIYTGKYWFTVPKHAVWFAYHNGSMKKSNYITRHDEETLKNTFENINMIIFGYIVAGIVFPVKIDNPIFIGQWDATIEFFKARNFNIVFQTGYPTYKNAYFVNDK